MLAAYKFSNKREMYLQRIEVRIFRSIGISISHAGAVKDLIESAEKLKGWEVPIRFLVINFIA
jgi:hypothetical protein